MPDDAEFAQWEFTLAVSGPSSILDRSGNLVEALAVDFSLGSLQSTAWLGSDLHVIRQDWCAAPCADLEVDWTYAGQLAPFGVGYGHIMAAGLPLAEVRADVTHELTADFNANGHEQRITTRQPSLFVPDRSAEWEFTYQAGELLPRRISMGGTTWSPAGSPTYAAFLKPLDLGGSRPEPRESEWKGFMFPGEDIDLFELGYTPKAVLDAVLEADERAQALLDGGGCVTDVALYLPRPSDGGALPNQLAPTTIQNTIAIGGPDGSGYRWNVQRQTVLFQEPTFEVDAGTPYESSVPCSLALQSPWPVVDAGSFLDRARGLELRSNGEFGFHYGFRHQGHNPGSPTRGVQQYDLMLYPINYSPESDANTVFFAYHTRLNPVQDWWDSWTIDHGDRSSVDRSEPNSLW